MRKFLLCLSIICLSTTSVPAEIFGAEPARKTVVRYPSQQEMRNQLCRMHSSVFKVPISIDPKLKAELVAKMGEPFAASLLRPVARTNLLHRCLCAKSIDARILLGC